MPERLRWLLSPSVHKQYRCGAYAALRQITATPRRSEPRQDARLRVPRVRRVHPCAPVPARRLRSSLTRHVYGGGAERGAIKGASAELLPLLGQASRERSGSGAALGSALRHSVFDEGHRAGQMDLQHDVTAHRR